MYERDREVLYITKHHVNNHATKISERHQYTWFTRYGIHPQRNNQSFILFHLGKESDTTRSMSCATSSSLSHSLSLTMTSLKEGFHIGKNAQTFSTTKLSLWDHVPKTHRTFKTRGSTTPPVLIPPYSLMFYTRIQTKLK